MDSVRAIMDAVGSPPARNACPELALFRHPGAVWRCPFKGEDRKWLTRGPRYYVPPIAHSSP
jgi:hypothetical protein